MTARKPTSSQEDPDLSSITDTQGLHKSEQVTTFQALQIERRLISQTTSLDFFINWLMGRKNKLANQSLYNYA